MTDRATRRLEHDVNMSAKTAMLRAVAKDCDGPVYVASAPPQTPETTPAPEAAPVRRLPAPNPAQGSSASGPALEPESTTTKAQQLARLHNQMKRESR